MVEARVATLADVAVVAGAAEAISPRRPPHQTAHAVAAMGLGTLRTFDILHAVKPAASVGQQRDFNLGWYRITRLHRPLDFSSSAEKQMCDTTGGDAGLSPNQHGDQAPRIAGENVWGGGSRGGRHADEEAGHDADNGNT